MKIIFTSLLVCIFHSAVGQRITVKQHPISGESQVQTSWEHFFKKGIKTRGFEMDQRILRQGDNYTFQLRITDQVRTHLVGPGHMLGLYQDDRKIVALKCVEGNRSREEKDFINYAISEEQIESILESEINVVKFEWERGITIDKLSNGDLLRLKNSLSMIKDNKRFDEKDNALSGWIRIYNATDPKTVIWKRIIGTDTGAFVELKMFGHMLQKGHRLNIYSGQDRISLFAKAVRYEHSNASGRDYTFALFPVTKKDLIFMSKSDFAKMTLQTTTGKIIITDRKEGTLNKLRGAAEKSQIIYFK